MAIGLCRSYGIRVHLEWDRKTERIQIAVLDSETLQFVRGFRGRCEVLPSTTPDDAWLNGATLAMLGQVEIGGYVTEYLGDKAAVAKFVAKWGDFDWLPEKLAL
ncbi:hypothetical protein [Streptomyces wuyuanensis]|uniref:hypothetical protein n=1 Tax=Streptomyces wuyuanensis TaxID=1196353 RepID=UPI00343B5329